MSVNRRSSSEPASTGLVSAYQLIREIHTFEETVAALTQTTSCLGYCTFLGAAKASRSA